MIQKLKDEQYPATHLMQNLAKNSSKRAIKAQANVTTQKTDIAYRQPQQSIILLTAKSKHCKGWAMPNNKKLRTTIEQDYQFIQGALLRPLPHRAVEQQ